MSKKPITSNLFRFVTLRTPQLAENKEIGFVSISETTSIESENIFVKAVQGKTTVSERATALKGAVASHNTSNPENTFTPFTLRKNVKDFNSGLYQFSNWLMRNKSSISYASVVANLNGASELNATQEQQIWNNLFHQTVAKKSLPVREALIQVLIANKFLKKFNTLKAGKPADYKFTDAEQKEFEKRASASVIIPKEVVNNSFKSSKTNNDLSTDDKKQLQSNLAVSIAKERVKLYEKSIEELAKASHVYKKAETKKHKEALATYAQAIKTEARNATPTIQTITDPNTNESIKILKYPEQVAKLNYTKLPQIPRADNSDEVIPTVPNPGGGTTEVKAVNYLSDLTKKMMSGSELSIYDTYDEIGEAIKARAKEETQFVLKQTISNQKTISVNGTNLNSNTNVTPYAFSGVLIPFNYNIDRSKTAIHMALSVKEPNLTITKATYSIKNEANTVNVSGSSFLNNSKTNPRLIPITLFREGLTVGQGTYTFSGQLTLSNGLVLSFSAPLTIISQGWEIDRHLRIPFDRIGNELSGQFYGICTVTTNPNEDTDGDNDNNGGGDNSGSDNNTTQEVPKLFGISQLGIADFRRVEQEVCCYVPGEVSHIENIMAKEYKERATRNLLSSETTTERTSEKEVEKLTDTTSTERNELSSEVSSVMNEDRATNFGANTSFSSNLFGGNFSAGTNFNSSSSNSVSNTNSQAKNYAQEVTERALERIVQKVSTKRTSRILKEFEENNTHGFDNRKGDKNITGVYRWVDKIYKNKLVNYGKRLMYEFAIPEPAKFYVDSLFTDKTSKIEKSSKLITPVLPVHPNKLENIKIQNAKDITELNYQAIASIYNAEVKPTPEQFSYTGTSLTKSQQGGDGSNKTNKAIDKTIRVPEGYKAVAAKTSGKKSHGDVQISVAGLNLPENSLGFVNIYPHYLTEVPVSGYFEWNWISNVNVVLKCERTQETFQKWQNETYKAIMDAYNERLREYNEAVKDQETAAAQQNDKRKELNSLFNRSIEKRELKRIAIELLAKPYKVPTAVSHYQKGSSTAVARTAAFQKHAEVVKFFEQAFDWEIMAYTFYPYFYANEANWKQSFEFSEANDPIFQAFLQSGMARTIVPVRPGFEQAVNWYMTTGEIWNGTGIVTDTDDDLFVSITEELLSPEGEVEGTWETRVPTSLTIIQAKSAALDEGGLPCNCDYEGNPIIPLDLTDPANKSGVGHDTVGADNNVA